MDYGHLRSRRQPPPPELRPPLQSDPPLHPRVGAARKKKPAIFNSIIGPAAWNGKAVFSTATTTFLECKTSTTTTTASTTPPPPHPKQDVKSEEKLESINPLPKLGQQPQPQPQSPTSPHRVGKAAECENEPESFNPHPQDGEQIQSQPKPPPPSPQSQAALPSNPYSFNLHSSQGLQPQPQKSTVSPSPTQQPRQQSRPGLVVKSENFYGNSTATWDAK
ncbi:hypothetical protein Ancab_000858 [Ancistrocladus abbreviatus]